jgi:TPR repeat protein
VIKHISVARMVAVRITAVIGLVLAVLTAGGTADAQMAPPRPALSPPPTARPVVPAPAPAAKPAVAAAPAHGGREPDLAYGAYQRGYFFTAVVEALKRADKGDVRAMTLLGELYSCQFCGIPLNEAEAARWYKLAADRGDRDAMFALAIFHMSRKGGLHDRNEAAKLLAAAAKLGHSAAAYDLGLLYLEGLQLPQDIGRAADLFKLAANEGNSEAQYALATLYKDGKGVPQNLPEAARLLAAASLADNLDAQVEYAIALFNGTGIPKDEARAAALFRKAALRGSPIAQNRLARLLTIGQGMPMNPTEALKWHLIARAGGNGDPYLDQYMAKQTPQIRAAAEKAAHPWTIALAPKS